MSEIAAFYKNKTIFLTGGTGFIGKLLIEQLLRKTEPRKLYLLIRQKKGVPSDVRMEKLFQDVVFDTLKAEKPNFLETIEIISGDLSEDNLGISDRYIETICEEVEVVIHGGASVRLNECFKSILVNLKGGLSMLALCHRINNLKAFVYISTAYSCCPFNDIKEEFYNVHITCEELLNLVENLTEDELSTKSKEILSTWPNPYTLSKVLVEDAVKRNAEVLPVAIIRPCIVMGTFSEPVPGWIDNAYGSNGLIVAAISAGLKVAKIDPKDNAEIVPGDMVASCTLAIAYKLSITGCSMINPIYNFVAEKETRITWGDFTDILKMKSKNLKPCDYKMIPNPFWFEVYSFLYHLLPSILIDIMLILINKTPRAWIKYRKMRNFLDVMAYFGTHSWNFSTDNRIKLWNELNDIDQQLFNFNTKLIVWPEYLENCFIGIIKYFLHEPVDSTELAVRKYDNKINKFYMYLSYGIIYSGHGFYSIN